jgi:hypothetical protein
MKPIVNVHPDGETATLTAPAGFMRLVLEQARQAAHASAMAQGVSHEWKTRWSARATLLGQLAAHLPEPANPRDPYGSVAGDPDLETTAPAPGVSDPLGDVLG